jgi:hypothetical protein
MKYAIMILIVSLLFSCKVSDPNGNGTNTGYDSAELVLTNKMYQTINVVIYDANETGSSYTLAAEQELRKTWQSNDPIFTENNGIVRIVYSAQSIETREINIQLTPGGTVYQNIGQYQSSFTIFNNTYSTITFYLQDGSSESNLQRTVSSMQSYVKTWNENDPLYTVFEGLVTLSYINHENEEINLQYYIPIGHHAYHQVEEVDYVLKISNNTNADAWYKLNGVGYPPMNPHSFDLFYTGDIPGKSSISIYYSGYHVFSNSDIIVTSPYFTTYFSIEADAGAISIRNNSDLRINSVYISANTSANWGSDVLSGYLYTNEEAIWTVEDGYWDLKIVDENNMEYTAIYFYVSLDETERFYFPEHFIETKDTKTGNSPELFPVEFKGKME